MNKLLELKKVIEESIEKEVKVSVINVFGYQFNYKTNFVKSVSTYWFSNNVVEEQIAPKNSESNNNNRPGTIKSSTEYIVIHDTASTATTADEYAHANYVKNGGGGTSWHYSVGENAVCHQIPDNEVAYHAGDQLKVKFSLRRTGVFGNNHNPKIDIINNYYYIDGVKTLIHTPIVSYEYENDNLFIASDKVISAKKAPINSVQGNINIDFNNKSLNDYGVRVDLIDGEYYIGPTYYNPTYDKIANRGGNLNSIGIETMVNQSSNLIKTWHRCAKLIAHLLVRNNLDLTRVKPHHFFSGKDCPMTLRRNNLWDYFMEMVKVEYVILTQFNDCEISLKTCDSRLENDGLINLTQINNNNDIINYQILLKHNNETLTLDYQIKIKDNN